MSYSTRLIKIIYKANSVKKFLLDFIFIVAVLITTVASLLVLPVIEITERKPLFLIRKSKMIKPEDYESLF